jgi:hypothetical protein
LSDKNLLFCFFFITEFIKSFFEKDLGVFNSSVCGDGGIVVFFLVVRIF